MKKVWIYLAFTFGITWLWFAAAIVATGALDVASSGKNPFATMAPLVVCAAVAMFCPLVGALLTKFVLRREERIDLMVRPRVRSNLRVYAAAWLFPAVLSVLGAVLFFVVFSDSFDPTMQAYFAKIMDQLVAAGVPAAELDATRAQLQAQLTPAAVAATAVFAVLVAPFVNMIPAFGEEAGWRGLLYPALAQRMGARRAVLVTGLIWGVWHAPMILVGHNYGVGYWGYPVTGVLVMCVVCVGISACLAWLTWRAHSVWPAALAHGAFNAASGVSAVFCAGGSMLLGPAPMGLLAAVPLLALGAVCWVKLPARTEGTA